jgi:hypothetical protein
MSEQTPIIGEDLPEQLRIRREKRADLIAQGIEPYPVAVARTKSLSEIRTKYQALETDTATGDIESLTGRIIFKRDTASFASQRCVKVMALSYKPCSHSTKLAKIQLTPGRRKLIWATLLVLPAKLLLQSVVNFRSWLILGNLRQNHCARYLMNIIRFLRKLEFACVM